MTKPAIVPPPRLPPLAIRHRGSCNCPAKRLARAASPFPISPTMPRSRHKRMAGASWEGRRPRLRLVGAVFYPWLVAESVTPLWSDSRPEEAAMQIGKVQNLRVAARALDGLGIPAEGVFSFWRAVGRANRGRGYVAGRMLQE